MSGPTDDQLRIAFDVLVRLVRSEYPADMSLADIAFTWAMASESEVEALRAVEPFLESAPK